MDGRRDAGVVVCDITLIIVTSADVENGIITNTATFNGQYVARFTDDRYEPIEIVKEAIAAGIVTNVATATATDDSGNKVDTVESKAVTTIERPSEAVADEKPAENENAPAEETPTDDQTDDGSSSDIVDLV